MKNKEFIHHLQKELSGTAPRKERPIIKLNISEKQLAKIIKKQVNEFLPKNFKIANWPKEIELKKPDWWNEPPKEIEIKNWPEPQEFPEIKIPDFPKFPEKIAIKKPKWYQKISLKQFKNDLLSGLAKLLVNILERYTESEHPLAVRMSNGKEFYNIVVSAVATGAPDPVGLKDSGGNTIDPAKHLSVNKAIEDLTQDINAAAYSQTTSHSAAYRFSGLYLKFSSGQSKDINLYLTNGSVDILLWSKASDTATSRVYVPDKSWELPADWELKLTISQTVAACSADILLLTTNN